MGYDYRYDYEIISAAGDGDLDALRNYLDKGGDPNAEYYIMYGDYVFTALGEAFANKHYGAMDMLLDYGASPDMDYDYYTNVIHAVAFGGDEQALDVLFNHGVKLEQKGQVYTKDAEGRFKLNPLMTAREIAAMQGHDSFAALCDRYAEMPALTEEAAVDKATLLAPNDRGDCMLDHPSVWRQFERVTEELQARDEVLTTAELLPHMERAVACNAFGALLKQLNAAGESLRADALLEADGSPNALLEKLMDKRQVQAVFQADNWRSGSLQELTRLYRALPETAQTQVSNYRSLRTQLGPEIQGAGRSMREGFSR